MIVIAYTSLWLKYIKFFNKMQLDVGNEPTWWFAHVASVILDMKLVKFWNKFLFSLNGFIYWLWYFPRYELFSSLIFGPVQTTEYRQTDSDAYEPTVQIAQVG